MISPTPVYAIQLTNPWGQPCGFVMSIAEPRNWMETTSVGKCRKFSTGGDLVAFAEKIRLSPERYAIVGLLPWAIERAESSAKDRQEFHSRLARTYPVEA